MRWKLVLVLLSLAMGLVVAEGLVRSLAGDILPKGGLYELDPYTGKRMRAGWRGRVFGQEVRINSLGLRNPELSYAKPPGRYRILVLGDSWTFGYRIAERDCFPRQLERRLNERARLRGDPPRFEVINAGVIGYSTTQEAAYLRVRGHRFSPDLVVVAYYPVNDTDLKHRRYARYLRLYRIHPWLLKLYRLPGELRLNRYLRGAKTALRERWAELRASRNGRPLAELRRQQAVSWLARYDGEGWKDAREALREIGGITAQLNARGLLLLLPDVRDLGAYIDLAHPRIEPLIRAAASEAGLEIVDLLAVFQSYRGQEDRIRDPGLRHPNAAGYAVIAQALAEVIEGAPPPPRPGHEID